MDVQGIPIGSDNFVVHKSEKYVDALKDIMEDNDFWPDVEHQRGRKQK